MIDPIVKKSEDIAERLFKSYVNSTQGNITFANNIDKWRCEINCDWNKNKLIFNISLLMSNPSNDFVECELYGAGFISAIIRARSYSFKGKTSEYSEILLSSDYTKTLMNQSRPKINLLRNKLNYSCEIKKCTKPHLVALVNLTLKLMNELNEV